MMMEVIEFQNFHKDLLSLFTMKNINLQKDERYQWNLFINQFLNYSISHGRAKKNYLPSKKESKWIPKAISLRSRFLVELACDLRARDVVNRRRKGSE